MRVPGIKPARTMDLDGLLAFAEMCSPTDVERFAGRYGVLRLCKHGKLPGRCSQGLTERCDFKRLGNQYVEPMEEWLDLAAKTRAIVCHWQLLEPRCLGRMVRLESPWRRTHARTESTPTDGSEPTGPCNFTSR